MTLTTKFNLWALILLFLAAIPALRSEDEVTLLDATGKVIKSGNDDQIMAHCRKLAALNSDKACKKLVEIAVAVKSDSLPLEIVPLIAGMERSCAHAQLLKLSRSLKDPAVRELILGGLNKTCDATAMKADGWKNANGLVRAVAYAQMALDPVTPTEEIKAQLDKETDPDAQAGLAQYMGQCAAKDVESAYARSKLATLVDSKDSYVQGLALKSIARIKDKSMLDMVRSHYDHPDWRFRLGILEAVGEAWGKDREGTSFILACMKKEDGRLRSDCARILAKITGKDHGVDAGAWSVELSGGEERPDIRMGDEVKTVHPTYYGVEIASKRIIFIFDRTGSMINASDGGVKKFQTAKDKLCDVIKELDKNAKKANDYQKVDLAKRTHFTIIMFSDKCQWWKKEMVPASDENVKAACDWVQKLTAEGPTHADLPLKEAIEFAKAGSKKKSYEPKAEVDTIFFVTDGSPYKMEFGQGPQVGEMVAKYSDEILGMVEQMNKDLKIVINAAGILGANATSPFLDRLAALTGGKVVYVPFQ